MQGQPTNEPGRVPRLHVGELWRYPVKSLRGERVDHVAVGRGGLAGDRLVHVRGARGLLTGRTRNGLLTLTATTGPDGQAYVQGDRWDSRAAAERIAAAAGPDAHLVHDRADERFDVLPLLVATDSEIARLGVDGRRLRPNIVIHGAVGQAERHWPGSALRIGDLLIGVHTLRARCVVTTIDPDTGEQDLEVLRRIRREFDGVVALDCWPITQGTVSVGDPVEVVPLPAGARARPGGWVTGAPYPVAAGA